MASVCRYNTATVSIDKKNFLRQFRDTQNKELQHLTAHQFFQVWMHYDKDGKVSFRIPILRIFYGLSLSIAHVIWKV